MALSSFSRALAFFEGARKTYWAKLLDCFETHIPANRVGEQIPRTREFFLQNNSPETEVLQWRPIQLRAFYSNENGLFCPQSLSIAPLF